MNAAIPARRPATVDAVDALLPQTQCGQCGYRGCRPYAEAIVRDGAPINRCPPGGEPTLRALAALLGTDPLPLDRRCGVHKPPQVVEIDEAACIGCTKCIQACPVDAIVGAAGRMHTVIAACCTGCELCIPPCPVDCIVVRGLPASPGGDAPEAQRVLAAARKARYQARERRLAEARRRTGRPLRRRAGRPGSTPEGEDRAAMREEIAAAIARVRARRGQKPAGGSEPAGREE